MVDPDNPKEPVPVSVVPLSGKDLAWDMIRRQGPLAIALGVAVWFLWAAWQSDRAAYDARQTARETLYSETAKKVASEHAIAVDKLAVQQTQQLKDQATTLASTFEAQVARTERLLGRKIEANAEHVKAIAAKVENLTP